MNFSAIWNRLSASARLAMAVVLVYAPFLGQRMVRMAGDEKVYVSQALEMARAGNWFVQTLQDIPDYYKGPLHYILLRAGLGVFGLNAWAVLYMNLIFLVLAALSLSAIVRRNLPDWKGGDFWTGFLFATGAGLYAHAFASQMEIELASIFAIGAYFLDRTRREDSAWAFWIVAGVAGWAKSPLHSVFLGGAGVLFWLLDGQLLARLRRLRDWAAVLAGVAISAGGYAPAYFLDYRNFYERYYLKETLYKSLTFQPWTVAIYSAFGFYLAPWIFQALIAYADLLTSGRRLFRSPGLARMLKLGFGLAFPSVAFFIWHPYRFENYNLPVISGIILCVAAAIGSGQGRLKALYRWSLLPTALVSLVVPIAVTALQIRIHPSSTWWPQWIVPLAWIGGLSAAGGIFKFGFWDRWRNPAAVAWSIVPLYLALGSVLTVVGEREMVDLRAMLRASERPIELGYYNLNHNIWSEWGLLSFWIGQPVLGLHQPETLKEALIAGRTLLVTDGEPYDKFLAFIHAELPQAKVQDLPWKRWKTRGQAPDGSPLWKEAWRQRELTVLERNYHMIRVEGPWTKTSGSR